MIALDLAAVPVDNRPGDPAIPPWLLHLDDPGPPSVVFLGAPADDALRWFRDRGTAVVVADGHDRSRAPAADLLVVGPTVGGRSFRSAADAAWLGRFGAVVLPGAPDAAWRAALHAADLTTVRASRPLGASGGRRSPRHHVAVRAGRSSGPRPDGPLPAWLEALAAVAIRSSATVGWSLRVPSAYPSQKAVAIVWSSDGDRVVAKVTRHPRFNPRLANEAAALDQLARRGGAAASRAPAVRGMGEVAGLAVVVEEAVDGRPFLERSRLRAGCPLADDAVLAVTQLGAGTVRTVPGSRLADPLDLLLRRFADRHRPPVRTLAFLEEQVAALAAVELPSVLFHGDLGTWNLLVEEPDADRGEERWADRVRVLDWESAEEGGPPLWDLLHLVRSYVVRVGRRRGLDRDRAINRHLYGSSPLARQAAAWVEGYRTRIGLDPELVEPLLHTCWMHRAVKESSRLEPDAPGHYGPLCLRTVEHRDAPGVRRLVGR